MSKTEHDPKPVADMDVTLCSVCFEKLRRKGDGWEHFGEDQPWEPMTLGPFEAQGEEQ